MGYYHNTPRGYEFTGKETAHESLHELATRKYTNPKLWMHKKKEYDKAVQDEINKCIKEWERVRENINKGKL